MTCAPLFIRERCYLNCPPRPHGDAVPGRGDSRGGQQWTPPRVRRCIQSFPLREGRQEPLTFHSSSAHARFLAIPLLFTYPWRPVPSGRSASTSKMGTSYMTGREMHRLTVDKAHASPQLTFSYPDLSYKRTASHIP